MNSSIGDENILIDDKKKKVSQYINNKAFILRNKGINISAQRVDSYIKQFINDPDDFDIVKGKIDDVFNDEFNSIYDNGDSHSFIPDNSNSIIGGDWNYQLVDVVNIYDDVNNMDILENEKKNLFNDKISKYFESNLPIYDGMKNIDYDELANLSKNLRENYSFITPSKEFKMNSIIDKHTDIFDSNGKLNNIIYDFSKFDSLYLFARKNNLSIKSGVLLDENISDNLKKSILDVFRNDPNKARSMLTQFFSNYFSTIGKKYNLIEWDILSVDDDFFLNGNFLRDVLGDDYYIEILKIARDNLGGDSKNGIILRNEDNIKKREKMVNLINKIRDYEKKNNIILIDFIGLSGRYNDKLSDSDIEKIFKDFACFDKKISIDSLSVLKTGKNDANQSRVFKSVIHFGLIYDIFNINFAFIDDKISDEKYKDSTFANCNGKLKKGVLDCLKLFKNNSVNSDLSFFDGVSLVGKAVGAYLSYQLISLLNCLNNNQLTYDEKMDSILEYKNYLSLNKDELNLGNLDIESMDFDDILKLISNAVSSITAFNTEDISNSFDSSIDTQNGFINNEFNINDIQCDFIKNNELNVDVVNLFGNDFNYPKNLDCYLENIYSNEDRLLTQKEKNDVLNKLIDNYIENILTSLNDKNIKLDSIVVLNNILEEAGSCRWWSENFGDDYYVTLFQLVNKKLGDNIYLGWYENDIVTDKNKRDDFLSLVERVIQHDPFLISFISTDIFVDNYFDVDDFLDFVGDLNHFSKRVLDQYGANVKFKVSNLQFSNLENDKYVFSVVKNILNAISSKYCMGFSTNNLTLFNNFDFMNCKFNKTLQKYSHSSRDLFNLLNYDIDYNLSGSLLENNIINILQKNQDKVIRGILSCNRGFPDTFVKDNSISTRSQDFLQIESGARHVSNVTKNITSSFPRVISAVQSATNMGCVSPNDYLNFIPSFFDNNVINKDNKDLNKSKVLTKKNDTSFNNVGFSSYLFLIFMVLLFSIIFVLCVLYCLK